MKTVRGERDCAYGAAMLTLRTKIGLTQTKLADRIGIARLAVCRWEAGSAYPKPEHLKALIALAVQYQAFAEGSTAEEIRALWKMARQEILLDEHWLSTLLSEHHGPLPHMVKARVEETWSLLPVTDRPVSKLEEHAGHETETPSPILAVDQDTPVLQNLPFPPQSLLHGPRDRAVAHSTTL